MQTVQQNTSPFYLDKLVSNNGFTYLLIFVVMLLTYFPAVHAYYLHTDDYFWSYWGNFSNSSVIYFMSIVGRPLAGLLFCCLKWIKQVEALNLVRFLSLLNITTLVFLLFHWFKLNKIDPLLSLCIALSIGTLPTIAVYIAYFTTAPYGFSALLAIVALFTVHKSQSANTQSPWKLRALALLLLIMALSIYQIAAFYYWAMASVVVFNIDSKHFLTEFFKKMVVYFAVLVAAVLIYYIGWRWAISHFHMPSAGKYDARLFVHDPLNRAKWFLTGPLFEAGNLWNIHPNSWMASIIGLLTLLGVTKEFSMNGMVKSLVLLSFFPAAFILTLASFDPSLEYRTYLSIASLFVLFAFLGAYRLREWLLIGIVMVTLCSIFVTKNTVYHYFVTPDSLELTYIKNQIRAYQQSTGHAPEWINVVKLSGPVAPEKRNEIGEPSAQHEPNIRPIVMTALSELGIKNNNIHVSLSGEINAPTWKEYGTELDGLLLSSEKVNADPNANIIDMSNVRK